MDYKKDLKSLYLPKLVPTIIDVPDINYIILSGQGDPNREEFTQETSALYSISYAVKMSYKSNDVPEGYYEYTVFPLEGVWDLVDKSISAIDKNNYKYNIMIRQPDFLTEELFNKFLEQTKKKKPNPYLDKLRFEKISEGLCCQMMHIGSYDEETSSFNKMKEFCNNNGYERISLTHREIYLSDPRKVSSDKLKTVLRFKVKRI